MYFMSPFSAQNFEVTPRFFKNLWKYLKSGNNRFKTGIVWNSTTQPHLWGGKKHHGWTLKHLSRCCHLGSSPLIFQVILTVPCQVSKLHHLSSKLAKCFHKLREICYAFQSTQTACNLPHKTQNSVTRRSDLSVDYSMILYQLKWPCNIKHDHYYVQDGDRGNHGHTYVESYHLLRRTKESQENMRVSGAVLKC